MAKLRRLINGQKISFDTHQAGDGQQVNWRNVHLEKSAINKRGKLRVPLLSEEKPTNRGMKERDFLKMAKEVKKELRKNRDLLNDLARSIAEVVFRYGQGEATIQDALEAARKLADYFDISEELVGLSKEYFEKEQLVKFTSYHINPARNVLVRIVQSYDYVEVGQLTAEEVESEILN
ncbi:hypothetical protein [Pseudohongiella sp.]|nr:hypothetical protein [Pseudohongiella sp.]HDZ09315.1 hypothetical protein [Pseudohongiella sp.]HEA63836.1 hypothetical protein [Pseudohongiella sp.]